VLAFLNKMEDEGGGLPTTAVTLFGEGLGVQDLKYNQTGNDAAARFFDLRFTEYETGERTWAPFSSTTYFLSQMDLPAVPTLHLGPFSQETLDFYTNGKETVTGKQTHVREGVVVQPMIPREHEEIGRVILKSISPDYLLRKGDATEYE
jgi:RNA ligase (TIGR02306 family)